MMALGRVASPTSALAACSPPPPERWERAPGAVCSTFLSVRPGFACPDYGPWCVRGLSRHEIKRTAAARGVRPFRAPRMLFTWFLFSNPIHMGRGRGLRGAAALTFSIHLPSCVVWARRTHAIFTKKGFRTSKKMFRCPPSDSRSVVYIGKGNGNQPRAN